MPSTVLYVDDEPALRRAVGAWLGHHGVHVVTARSVETAIATLATEHVDGVFVDLWLADGSGFELYEHIGEHYPALAPNVVFITGDIVPAETTSSQLAMFKRPVLFKPFDLSELDRYVKLWQGAGAESPPTAPGA